MDVRHAEIKDSAEQIGGGGVSIFYCHTLQLLFFSYVQGKSFMAPLKSVSEELRNVFRIEVSTAEVAMFISIQLKNITSKNAIHEGGSNWPMFFDFFLEADHPTAPPCGPSIL